MAASSHSFIDIAALDAVRGHFAAADGVVVLTDDLAQVIWANGPGAAILGFSGIEAAIGAESGLSRSARRQIEATPGYPEIRVDRSVTVRMAAGLISQVTVFRASRLSLPGDEAAIMLVVPFGAAASRSTEEIAHRAISGFDEPGHYLALLDADGRPIATTPGFGQLGMEAGELSRLVRDMAGQGDRLLKRIVRVAGHAMPVGLARLRDDPALHLLITVDERQMAAEPLESPAAVVDDSQAPVAAFPQAENIEEAAGLPSESATGTAGEADQPREIVVPDAEQPGTAEEGTEAAAGAEDTALKPLAALAEIDPDEPAAAGEESPSPGHSQAGEGRSDARRTGQHDAWYFSDSASPPDASGETKPTEPVVEPGAVPVAAETSGIDRSAAPVRFVWRTDAEGRFTSVSPEFVTAVGAEAADIVGLSFAEAAGRLALDPYGEIAALLERRDTWSGRSVLWPVAGTELMAPVDLAALPAYDRERRFEGFRGFGVVRLADAVADPRRTGVAIAAPGAQAEPSAEAGPQAAPDIRSGEPDDPFRGEVPVLDVTSKPRERRYSDKVIRLAEHRPSTGDKGLSPLERIAFREIGEHLKRTSSEPRSEAPQQDETASVPPGEAPPEDEGHAAAPALPEVAGGECEPVPAAGPGEVPAAERADVSVEPRSGPQESFTDATTTDQGDEAFAEAAGQEQAHAQASESDDAPAALSEDGARDGQEGAADAAGEEPSGGAEPSQAAAAAGDDAGAGDLADAVATEDASDGGDGIEPVAAASKAGSGDGRTYASRSLFDFVQRDSVPATSDEPSPAVLAAASEAPPLKQSGFLPSAFAERRADTSILAQLPIAVLIHAGDTLHYANDAFFQLTGYDSIDELAAHGGLGALLSGPADDRRDGDNRVLLRSRDGSEFPVNAFLQSVPWLGGKALLLTLTRQPAPVAEDAAMREKQLQARLAELRTILDTATDGVVLIDNDGVVRSISRPAEALFGYEAEQIVGKPFTALFAIESQRSAQDYLSGLSGTGVASVLNDGREVIGREAQGRFIPLFMTIGRLPGEGGYCAVLRDITQWKRAEEDLTQARAQAERTSSQKSDFLARVSHEIRTPLNAIIGFSELMLDEKFGPITNDRYRDYLRDINRSGNHVLDLVNDLLDISKIEAGQQEMEYQAISLNDALTETVAMMQPQANRERVIIRSSLATKLPEVVADLRSVRQIALNILSNAVRYTQAGGQVIVSTAYEANGEVVMRVRDTGIGMTSSEIEQALKPFKQVNALKRPRGDGTGLGLPLTKAMVEANRAKFAIFSTPGEGTLVEVTFPSTRVLVG